MCACIKWLQSCPALCDHMGCSLSGSSLAMDSPGRILEWVVGPPPGIFLTKKVKPHISYILHCRAASFTTKHLGNTLILAHYETQSDFWPPDCDIFELLETTKYILITSVAGNRYSNVVTSLRCPPQLYNINSNLYLISRNHFMIFAMGQEGYRERGQKGTSWFVSGCDSTQLSKQGLGFNPWSRNWIPHTATKGPCCNEDRRYLMPQVQT